jgi:hypothetical protein
MVRVLARLGAVVLGVLLLTTVQSPPAGASGPYGYGCRIAPGYTFTFNDPCGNDKGANSYGVAFAFPALQGVSGYTYTWSVTGGPYTVFGGCGSTDYFCNVTVRNVDREYFGVGTYSGNGLSGSGTAYAYITRMDPSGGGPIP